MNSDAAYPPATMPRFVAIDGLRFWMAWLVLFSHVVEQAWPAGLHQRWIEIDPGGQGVYAFIVISGFVITHLLVERQTNYAAYLLPRFMRLFPAFLIAVLFGALAYWFAAGTAAPNWFSAVHGRGWEALQRHPIAHFVLHLTMLHGAVPDQVLDYAQYALVPPGWSVSLEWQFYLVAPAAVWLCRTRDRAILLVVAVVLLSVFYHEVKDGWERPSLLAGSAKWFLIGIGCRLAAPKLAGWGEASAAVGLGIAFTLLWLGTPALAIWFLVYSFILRRETASRTVDGLYVWAMRALFESRPIQALAERSYSTYLLHWPVIMLIGAGATAADVSTGWPLAFVLLLAVPATLIVQEPVYRFVEVPGRSLGRQWAKRLGARAVKERPAETMAAESVR